MSASPPHASPADSPASAPLAFPADFMWGAATAAYQVEGAAQIDGRGPSVWDTFSHTPGRVQQNANGDVAVDQYHRFPQDVAMMKNLGLHSYRFSISWPRVMPTGHGTVNQKGLDHYRRLVDTLTEAGIVPLATLWHWDTPQALQDKGGWESRDTAKYFADYADTIYQALGSDVPTYLTLNEPRTVVMVGYLLGIHAPGFTDLAAATRALHHLLLGHGLAVEALRASGVKSRIGPAFNLTPTYAADDSQESKDATALEDSWNNRLYLDPLFKGSYPQEGLADVIDEPALDAVLKDGDLKTISLPIDVLGVNYYGPAFVQAGRQTVHKYPTAQPADWLEIYPRGLFDLLTDIDRNYGGPQIMITENGRPTETAKSADGTYPDDDRIQYVHDHLVQARLAIAAGVRLEGYQLWSLMDNFEWAEGYEQRFGIVHVDFETQERTPKKSFGWYSEVIRSNGASL
ncbi:MAG: GH1 family beta-glucosidase [Actinomycetota bacterium]